MPAQSLTMMNDQRVAELAVAWANRTLERHAKSDNDRVRAMFSSAFGRSATDDESELALSYLGETTANIRKAREKREELENRIVELESAISSIKRPARERLLKASGESDSKQSFGPQPIAAWEFDSSAEDVIGGLHCESKGGATIVDGSAVVRDGGYFISARLDRDLRAKTLEAWVRLDDLEQRGGGVMTIQTPDGVIFDSIVYAEQQARRWLAGSNGFVRSQQFQGGEEVEAADRPVHIAITYQEDGTITGYRNGKPYGKPYASSGPFQFKKGNAVVSFGLRHLPNDRGRQLQGRVLQARLYDHALTADEIAATSGAVKDFVSEKAILAELSDANGKKIAALRLEIENATKALEGLGELPSGNVILVAWTELAKALFMFKEFVYIY